MQQLQFKNFKVANHYIGLLMYAYFSKSVMLIKIHVTQIVFKNGVVVVIHQIEILSLLIETHSRNPHRPAVVI